MPDVDPRTASVSTIFELSRPGRRAFRLPVLDVPEKPLGEIFSGHLADDAPALPEVSEIDVVRHYTKLSTRSFGVDTGFYPLGSCTMKYNPKVNEEAARLAGLAGVHPLQSEDDIQGLLELLHRLERSLCELSGMARVTLQPAAGAHGEFTAMLMIRKALAERGQSPGEKPRRIVLIPDSAHGTNPASAAIAGFEMIEVKSDGRGLVDLDGLRKKVSSETAAFMLTNPNTLGLFEENVVEIARIVHEAGGFMYLDGANLNAFLGVARPAEMGFDVVHFNLHKTFSTPHGGGGPGAGPVGVAESLVPYLPVPLVEKEGDRYRLDWDRPKSIGKVHAFYGNVGILIRAYAYIRSLGAEGLRRVAEIATLNANYLRVKLRGRYHLPYDRICQHEAVFSARNQAAHGVKARDIAKRLLDYGFYAPTVYFPLVVEEALMIEPVETESREEIDRFVDAMTAIADEAENNPDVVRTAPHTTPVRRLDDTRAVREPDLRWKAG
ncbi:MAG: aminomethyl-transferring glycine dehydrogenase subunit GcvPB [Nitrospirota bacterium]|mgnify:FL=1